SDHEANLRSRLMQIETARNHLAFRLSQHREKLLEQNREIDKEVLQKIKTHIGLMKRKVEEIKRKKEAYQSAHDRSSHYTWLKQAVEEYTDLLHRKGKLPRILLPIIGLIFLVGGIIFTIISIPLLVLILLGMAFLMTLLYVLILPRLTRKAIQSEELNRLHKVFKKRFQTEISDLSSLKERLQDQEGESNRAKMLQDQLVQDEGDLDILKSEVSDYFFAITAEHIEPSKWNDTVNSVERKIRKLDTQIREKEISLAQLGVDESDYITEKADVEYSKQEHEEILQELAAVKIEIEEEHKKLDLLKQRICDQTQDIFTTPWETLIENLRNKREAILNNYRKLTAEMIGKNRVFQVILELRREEDSKIVKGLQSKDILGHLSRFTGNRYSSINLDGEELIVSSNTNNYVLSDLSTGAQEQILLALRIGFAQKWLNQDSLFLILDDAFQYSDWQRRPWLMETMVDLAKKGWQIFYFSMDDHIRGLFEKKGKIFKEQLKIVELTN
ncbi:ATP-binding protein, partial [bacterium]